MDFNYNDQQLAFADTFSKFVADRYGSQQREAYQKLADGYDAEVWRELAGIGLIYLRQDEADGGLQGSAADLYAAMRSLGPALMMEPWLPTLLASRLITTLGSEAQRQQWLPGLASGEALVGMALSESGLSSPLSHLSTQSRREARGFVVTGSKKAVLAGKAGHYIVSTKDEETDALRLLLISDETTGLAKRVYRAVDGSFLCDLELDNCLIGDDALLGHSEATYSALEDALAESFIALGAEALGIMDTAISQTVEHLKLRKQFGTPLASFQVLQHRLADCSTEIELVKGLAVKAALLADDEEASRTDYLAAAFGLKALTSHVAKHVAEETVQLHGAIGITEELWVGQAMKRLLMIAILFGDERNQTLYTNKLKQAAQ